MRRLQLWLALFAVSLLGCIPSLSSSGAVLDNVRAIPPLISPNPDAGDHTTSITYDLSEDAVVSIWLEDERGQQIFLRQDEPRPAGSYAAAFDGTYVPPEAPTDRRTLADGRYRFTVRAVTHDGREYTRQGELVVQNADRQPLRVTNLVAVPATISPNGDGKDDELILGWDLSKEAEVKVFATDAQQRQFLLQSPVKRDPGPDSLAWNGKAEGQLLPDGAYLLHVRAADRTGNVTEVVQPVTLSGGGKAKLDILKVVFSPTAIAVGGIINVSITVKNTGEVPIWSSCPKPGTAYTTNEKYTKFTTPEGDFQRPECFERPGAWRVGVEWDQAGSPYPARWAVTDNPNIPLLPGEEKTVTGTIQVLITQVREIFFYATIEQGGVGFPGGRRGITKIIVSY